MDSTSAISAFAIVTGPVGILLGSEKERFVLDVLLAYYLFGSIVGHSQLKSADGLLSSNNNVV